MSVAQYVMFAPPSVQDMQDNVVATPNMSASVMIADTRVSQNHTHSASDWKLHAMPVQPQDYTSVSFKESMYKYGSYAHVSNAMIYSRGNRMVHGKYFQPADILIVLREDGYFGFPGGHFEQSRDASIVDGLNRELAEEIGFGLKSKHKIIMNDYVSTSVIHKTKHVIHLFAHEMSPKDFSQLEKKVPSASHFGIETFGSTRVPLYNMEDGFRGFPAFLNNRFVGNTKEHLILGIRQRQLVAPQQLNMMLQHSQQLPG